MASGKREIIANIERLNDFMDANGLAALVARSGQNFTYLSGVVYPGTLARLLDLTDVVRGVMILWPRQGEPVIVTNSIAAGVAERDAWAGRIELYEGYVDSPYACLCKVLQEYGLERARVGFEKNYVSAAHWQEVRSILPNMEMIDCVDMMDRVRWIKTPGEVEKFKIGADHLDEVFIDVFARVRAGHTERDAHGMMVHECLKRGAGWAHGILNASTNTIPYAGEGDTVFQPGDVLRTDYVAFWDGYPGHQSRTLIFGQPSTQQEYEYKTVRDIYLQTIDRCRAGTRVGDIFDFVVGAFADKGWDYKSILVGHGVGAWWHQQEPILARGSDTILEEGMVLALEPYVEHWHIQDMVLVGQGAPEILSDRVSTEEPFIAE